MMLNEEPFQTGTKQPPTDKYKIKMRAYGKYSKRRRPELQRTHSRISMGTVKDSIREEATDERTSMLKARVFPNYKNMIRII